MYENTYSTSVICILCKVKLVFFSMYVSLFPIEQRFDIIFVQEEGWNVTTEAMFSLSRTRLRQTGINQQKHSSTAAINPIGDAAATFLQQRMLLNTLHNNMGALRHPEPEHGIMTSDPHTLQQGKGMCQIKRI